MDSTQLMQFASNVLSILTILSCLFLKVPQILQIRERKSGDGINILAMIMEITGFTIVTVYNYVNSYSLMTYMEYPIILLQIYVLLFHVLLYKDLLFNTFVSTATASYFAIAAAFATGMLPKHWLNYILPLCTPLSSSAKLTYMYGIYKAGHAENVSLVTWLISVSTNLARVFTVYVDSADTTLMLNFLVSATLSCGVLGLAWLYQLRPRDRPVDSPRQSHDN